MLITLTLLFLMLIQCIKTLPPCTPPTPLPRALNHEGHGHATNAPTPIPPCLSTTDTFVDVSASDVSTDVVETSDAKTSDAKTSDIQTNSKNSTSKLCLWSIIYLFVFFISGLSQNSQ
jgi:hypothetical protein